MTKLLCCVIICLTLALGDTRRAYTLQGDSWRNEVQKCGSGGEGHKTLDIIIGNLGSLGLSYGEIDELTTVIAVGTFKGSAGNNTLPWMLLRGYGYGTGYKQFVGDWNTEAVCGWSKQRARVQLNIKFLANGVVELNNYVYSASWGAVTCATTQSFVDSVQIIN